MHAFNQSLLEKLLFFSHSLFGFGLSHRCYLNRSNVEFQIRCGNSLEYYIFERLFFIFLKKKYFCLFRMCFFSYVSPYFAGYSLSVALKSTSPSPSTLQPKDNQNNSIHFFFIERERACFDGSTKWPHRPSMNFRTFR